MPYASNAELPAYVKKLPAGKQSQWRAVFNSCLKDGNDEGRCFRMANGVVKKEISDFDTGTYTVAEGVELEWAEKAYFVTESEIVEPEVIYDSGRREVPSLWSRIVSHVVGTKDKSDVNSLLVIKQSDGRLRWFGRYSNAWLDRDGEILTEAAHKEYIAWAYDNGTLPPLWLWHTPNSRIGQSDWLDFADGFAHASGLIDEGKESVVDRLSSESLGMSHGFLALQQGKYVSRYRSYELSILPRDRAAVETSGFNLLEGSGSAMAFTDEKRKWLVSALGEDAVVGLEKSTEAIASDLKALGVEYKTAEEAAEASNQSQTEGFKALAEQVATLTTTVQQLVGVVAEVKQTATEAKTQAVKSTDEQIEDAFLARVAKAFGQNGGAVRPSESQANVAATATKEAPQTDFFSQMIGEQFGSLARGGVTPQGGVGTPAVASVSASDGPTEVRS